MDGLVWGPIWPWVGAIACSESIHVEILNEGGEHARVEGGVVLAAPAQEGARHGVARLVREALGDGAERRRAAGRGGGGPVVRRRTARDAVARVRPVEVGTWLGLGLGLGLGLDQG